jgi:predicted kinase
LSYRVAKDNLQIGNDVVADSCNPIELTRHEWQEVAASANAAFLNIEIICSIPEIHRNRLEIRLSDIAGLPLPAWHEVKNRMYDAWKEDRVVHDTANKSIKESLSELIYQIKQNIGCRLPNLNR